MDVADFVVQRLGDWGVRRLYGYPGDGINGVFGALQRATDRVEFVQTRHEETAALMACAHAKWTGEPGVCVATSGPGAIHLLNGLYDAKLDRQPVVALVGQQARSALGGNYIQEVNLPALFGDVAAYVHTLVEPAQARHLVDRAFRVALAERAVTCLVIPADVQTLPYEDPPHTHGTIHTSVGWRRPRVVPAAADLQAAADVLNAGRRVAILAGQGALGASRELVEVADLLGAGVAKALLGRAVLPDDLPFVTGAIGLLGTRPSDELMRGCDTLLMIGTSFPYSEFLPREGEARGVQIDLDGRMLGLRFPTEVNLQGDSAETLRALIPLLRRKEDRSWLEQIEAEVAEWWQLVEARAASEAEPVNPQLVFSELSDRLPDRCVISADSGSVANWYARNLRLRPGMLASLSGNLATMGCGVPYAIAAKFAYPDRVAIALVGDGAMQMNGMAELITIAKYWRRWTDPRLVVLVLNNRDLNQVTWEQRVLEGNPRFAASQDVPDVDYAFFARQLGLEGIRVASPGAVGDAWSAALKSGRPAVLDVVTDPEVPPLPPHVTFEQARMFAGAVAKGDPARGRMISRVLRQTLAGVRPGRGRVRA